MADLTPPFTVHCDAAFRTDGVWVIQATLRYRDGVPAEGDRLGEARLALLQAIARENLRGRAQGATVARVFLDEGRGEVVELDAG